MSVANLGAALLRRLDPETAHGLALKAAGLHPGRKRSDDPILQTHIGQLVLPNPVGLAAGLDKNAEALGGLSRMGFGFLECGSVTPLPQPGNPRPRLFRLNEDRAVINRMGFNNAGLEAFARRLERRPSGVVLGANLGANKDAEDRAADYVTGLTRLAGLADYFTINISSPNTPGLRALQDAEALEELLSRVAKARPKDAPVLLKIAPDLEPEAVAEIVEAVLAHGLDGLIVSNTTLDRPPDLRSPHAGKTGGLSGAPLKFRAMAALKAAAQASAGRLPLIAAGGIDSGEEAYARIRAGACAVQIYSALVYEGPGLVERIKRDLAGLLKANGFTSLMSAVGRPH